MVKTPRPRLRLVLRWSWRDLRAHWAKVVAIALVLAIGTGGYAGLTSTVEWRQISYDLNYRELAMYDLRVDLAPGSSVEEGTLAALAAALPHHDRVGDVEERLIVPTQVDASTPTDPVLVRGEIVGSDFADSGPEVGSYYPWTGRLLTAEDNGAPVVMVERNFAKFYDLEDRGRLTVSGDRTVEFVGQATPRNTSRWRLRARPTCRRRPSLLCSPPWTPHNSWLDCRIGSTTWY
jgi:putative ABC transport system permease protein